ncbi:hypothetical protein V8E53_015196 [Lactarius tabidus]|jgi:hypothetical protein
MSIIVDGFEGQRSKTTLWGAQFGIMPESLCPNGRSRDIKCFRDHIMVLNCYEISWQQTMANHSYMRMRVESHVMRLARLRLRTRLRCRCPLQRSILGGQRGICWPSADLFICIPNSEMYQSVMSVLGPDSPDQDDDVLVDDAMMHTDRNGDATAGGGYAGFNLDSQRHGAGCLFGRVKIRLKISWFWNFVLCPNNRSSACG